MRRRVCRERRRRDSNQGMEVLQTPDPSTGRQRAKGFGSGTNSRCHAFATFPADLAAVVAAWPELPEAVRAGIVALVKAVIASWTSQSLEKR